MTIERLKDDLRDTVPDSGPGVMTGTRTKNIYILLHRMIHISSSGGPAGTWSQNVDKDCFPGQPMARTRRRRVT